MIRNNRGTGRNREDLSFYERMLVVLSYLLFFPVFSILFTERRQNVRMAYNAAQAMFLWCFFVAVMICLKAAAAAGSAYADMSLVGRSSGVLFFFFWIYMLKCSFVFLMGKKADIPFISDIADRLA